MNTRRNFLLKGGLAATALASANPIKSLANSNTPFSLLGTSNKIAVLHTQYLNGNSSAIQSTANVVNKINTNNGYSLLFSTGNELHNTELNGLDIHAALPASTNTSTSRIATIASNGFSNETTFESTNQTYKIIYKGDVKIGIIGAVNDENNTLSSRNTIEEVNTVARHLKVNQHCNLVVCLSNLGYSNKSKIDDQTLAGESHHIDLIIGNHNSETQKILPNVLLNKNKAEVLMNYTGNNEVVLGNIEIEFDSNRNKKNIAFANVISDRG